MRRASLVATAERPGRLPWPPERGRVESSRTPSGDVRDSRLVRACVDNALDTVRGNVYELEKRATPAP
eukprot:2349287-Alexandrium_andersonii.AAC.1